MLAGHFSILRKPYLISSSTLIVAGTALASICKAFAKSKPSFWVIIYLFAIWSHYDIKSIDDR